MTYSLSSKLWDNFNLTTKQQSTSSEFASGSLKNRIKEKNDRIQLVHYVMCHYTRNQYFLLVERFDYPPFVYIFVLLISSFGVLVVTSKIFTYSQFIPESLGSLTSEMRLTSFWRASCFAALSLFSEFFTFSAFSRETSRYSLILLEIILSTYYLLLLTIL